MRQQMTLEIARETCVLPSRRASTRVARHWTRAVVSGWPLQAGVRDDIETAVSELVTNAVVHSSPETDVVTCALQWQGEHVRVEVGQWASDPVLQGVPELRSPGRWSENGRGLLMVDALSMNWGVDVSRDASQGGPYVWACFGVCA